MFSAMSLKVLQKLSESKRYQDWRQQRQTADLGVMAPHNYRCAEGKCVEHPVCPRRGEVGHHERLWMDAEKNRGGLRNEGE